MTAFSSLFDGGLSVIIGGVLSGTTVIGGTERVDAVHDLEWETTCFGEGEATYWVEVSDPFNPRATFPEMIQGATIIVRHTFAGVTTVLYYGYIISDTRSGYAGEKAVVNVICGGAMEVVKGRGDMGYVFDDCDTSQWFANKRNAKNFQVDTSDRVDIRMGDGDKAPHNPVGMVGYVAYEGAQYLLAPLPGIRWITGQASWNLLDHMTAALLWSPTYKVSRLLGDYTVIHQWTANTKGDNQDFSYAFGGSGGCGYVALAQWCDKAGGITLTADRFITLDNCAVHTDTSQKTVDQAMLKVAQIAGLAPAGYSTSTIGSVLPSMAVRPHVDPVSALATFAAQADCIVQYGYFKGQFLSRPMPTSPVTIRQMPNCYLVDATDAGVDWEPTQHPEDGIPRSVRLIYGKVGRSNCRPDRRPR